MNKHYALIIVEPSALNDREVRSLQTAKNDSAQSEAIETPQQNSLLLPLPQLLPFLGKLTQELQRGNYSYSIAFFDEKPIFHTNT